MALTEREKLELLRRIEAGRAVSPDLRWYVQHKDGCQMVFTDNPRLDGVPDTCTCGLDALLAGEGHAAPPLGCTSHYHVWEGPPIDEAWQPPAEQLCSCSAVAWSQREMPRLSGYKILRQAAAHPAPLLDSRAHMGDGDSALREVAHPTPPLQVDLTNHHNALACPYCNPRSLTFQEPATAHPLSVTMRVIRLDAAMTALESIQAQGYFLHDAKGRVLDSATTVQAISTALDRAAAHPAQEPETRQSLCELFEKIPKYLFVGAKVIEHDGHQLLPAYVRWVDVEAALQVETSRYWSIHLWGHSSGARGPK